MTHWRPMRFPMRGLWGGSTRSVSRFSGRAFRGILPSFLLYAVTHKCDIQPREEGNTQQETEQRESQGNGDNATGWSITVAYRTVAFLHVWVSMFLYCVHQVELDFLWLDAPAAQMTWNQRQNVMCVLQPPCSEQFFWITGIYTICHLL